MNRYKEIQFKGNLRSYQQRVLGNVDKYLADGKVNIVAAPGSGKSILGLELIRKLGEPCLILSPTKDSRDRWGECLKEHPRLKGDLYLETGGHKYRLEFDCKRCEMNLIDCTK